MDTRRDVNEQSCELGSENVGWVERGDTHHRGFDVDRALGSVHDVKMGIAALHPSYGVRAGTTIYL